MKKLLLVILMVALLFFVAGCDMGADEILSESERNDNNIERYERLLASDELSAMERRTVQRYLEAAIEWRDFQ